MTDFNLGEQQQFLPFLTLSISQRSISQIKYFRFERLSPCVSESCFKLSLFSQIIDLDFFSIGSFHNKISQRLDFSGLTFGVQFKSYCKGFPVAYIDETGRNADLCRREARMLRGGKVCIRLADVTLRVTLLQQGKWEKTSSLQ